MNSFKTPVNYSEQTDPPRVPRGAREIKDLPHRVKSLHNTCYRTLRV